MPIQELHRVVQFRCSLILHFFINSLFLLEKLLFFSFRGLRVRTSLGKELFFHLSNVRNILRNPKGTIDLPVLRSCSPFWELVAYLLLN